MLPKLHVITNGPPRDDFKLGLTYRRDPSDDPIARCSHVHTGDPYGSGEGYQHVVDFTVDIDDKERRVSVWILGYHSDDPLEQLVWFWADIQLVDDAPPHIGGNLLVGNYSFKRRGGVARVTDQREFGLQLRRLLEVGT